MQVQNLNFTGYKVNVPRKIGVNKSNDFFYNQVKKVIEECKLPAVIKNEGIDLPNATEKALEKLNKMNINYDIII